MKHHDIPYLHTIDKDSPLTEVSTKLDAVEKIAINGLPWPEFTYQPEVFCALGHNDSHLYLKYSVVEKHFVAKYNQINEPVYKDSCVECFISIDDDNRYYNLEFNALGVCLAGFGAGRHSRQLLSEDVLKKIKSMTWLDKSNENGNAAWQLVLSIPQEVFCFHELSGLNGLVCKANFYKCGDDLPQPHYLVWSPIDFPTPDFHLPNFFGKIRFGSKK